MLFQPSNISPSEINNSGAVDLSQGLTVTWQVNGDSPMIAYQIVFYRNNVASTQLYDTGRIALEQPFWGTNYKGNTQFFSVNFGAATLSENGLVNGHEYKFIITQWWSLTDSVVQSTASIIVGRSAPVISIDPITSPITSYSYSFTGQYLQADGDAINWLRWQISEKNSDGELEEPFLDTGKIYGTGELRVDYSGFLNGANYSINLTVETINGVEVSTGWTVFSVEYAVSTAEGQATACQTNDGNILLSWVQIYTTKGYDIYRLTAGTNVLTKIASVDDTVGQIRDWGVCSGQSYTYYIFPVGPLAYLTQPVISNTVNVKFWLWSIIEASESEENSYTVLAYHIFRYGNKGVNEGSFSNNNAPQILKNFTKYPTRQPDSANYLTGSVSGYIGTITPEHQYSDSLEQADALRNLSVSSNTIFLKDPAGHFLNIHTSQPVTISIEHKSAIMPKTVTLNWAEVGDATKANLISSPEDIFWPIDNILFTSITVNPLTGELVWTRNKDYEQGSVLSLVNGNLIQSFSPGYTVATLNIVNGNNLQATVDNGTGG